MKNGLGNRDLWRWQSGNWNSNCSRHLEVEWWLLALWKNSVSIVSSFLFLYPIRARLFPEEFRECPLKNQDWNCGHCCLGQKAQQLEGHPVMSWEGGDSCSFRGSSWEERSSPEHCEKIDDAEFIRVAVGQSHPFFWRRKCLRYKIPFKFHIPLHSCYGYLLLFKILPCYFLELILGFYNVYPFLCFLLFSLLSTGLHFLRPEVHPLIVLWASPIGTSTHSLFMSEQVFILLSLLTGSLAGYGILGWQC